MSERGLPLHRLLDRRQHVVQFKARGFALAEIARARPTAAYDDAWGGGLIDPAFFTRLVYQGV